MDDSKWVGSNEFMWKRFVWLSIIFLVLATVACGIAEAHLIRAGLALQSCEVPAFWIVCVVSSSSIILNQRRGKIDVSIAGVLMMMVSLAAMVGGEVIERLSEILIK